MPLDTRTAGSASASATTSATTSAAIAGSSAAMSHAMSHAMETAAAYRRRARSLRVLASSIEALPLMQLDSLGGVDTWQGPRPFRTLEEVRAYQHRLLHDAEELRSRAWTLEVRAADLERSATLRWLA